MPNLVAKAVYARILSEAAFVLSSGTLVKRGNK